MTADAATSQRSIIFYGANLSTPILFAIGKTSVGLRAGTEIEIDGNHYTFKEDTPVRIGDLVPGHDYAIGITDDGEPFAVQHDANPLTAGYLAGFHFAPGGHAEGLSGGDKTPAINPFSLWDIEFRPSCPDPRGMAMVDTIAGKRFWADIYLLGVDHLDQGTSRHGATIADGRDLLMALGGKGRTKKLDFATATEIYAHHGKRLLGAEEFFAAAYGVKERCSRKKEPTKTGDLTDGAERFISRRGLFDVAGTMWQWGTDGHPDDPRASLFGGSWLSGEGAGSRYAHLGYWDGSSHEIISARGACDHLAPA